MLILFPRFFNYNGNINDGIIKNGFKHYYLTYLTVYNKFTV